MAWMWDSLCAATNALCPPCTWSGFSPVSSHVCLLSVHFSPSYPPCHGPPSAPPKKGMYLLHPPQRCTRIPMSGQRRKIAGPCALRGAFEQRRRISLFIGKGKPRARGGEGIVQRNLLRFDHARSLPATYLHIGRCRLHPSPQCAAIFGARRSIRNIQNVLGNARHAKILTENHRKPRNKQIQANPRTSRNIKENKLPQIQEFQ